MDKVIMSQALKLYSLLQNKLFEYYLQGNFNCDSNWVSHYINYILLVHHQEILELTLVVKLQQ